MLFILQPPACHELRFPSLHRAGYSYAFPCNESGSVDLDTLSEQARKNYFYARSTIGKDFATPEISAKAR
jgi:hypothetical protein